MLALAVPWIISICLLWSLAYLLVLCSRRRLPFHEGDIVETRLSAIAAQTGRSRFVVRFRLALPGGRNRAHTFSFPVNGDPDQARESGRYRELQTCYSQGMRIRVHYVPHCEWLFGLIPEVPRFSSRGALVGIGAISLALAIWSLYLLGFLPV